MVVVGVGVGGDVVGGWKEKTAPTTIHPPTQLTPDGCPELLNGCQDLSPLWLPLGFY